MVQQLEDYITKLLKKGYSKNFIKEQLLKAGYDENEVFPLIHALEEQFYPKDTARRWHFSATVMGVIIIISITLFFLSKEKPVQLCTDTSCLTAAANACQPAQYYEDIDGTKMLYDVRGCVLTKKFTIFGSKEPKEMQDVLGKKEVECRYQEGRFDREWLDVFGGLEKCTGSLKEAVYGFRLAQEALRTV